MFQRKGILSIVLFLGILIGFIGCGKKSEWGKETPSQTSSQTASSPTTPVLTEPEPGVTVVTRNRPDSSPSFEPVPLTVTPLPQDSQRRNEIIQLALKYAGYYEGAIDGKVGPLTRKAIVAFQRDEGLQVDGKVGPATWSLLEGYLPEKTSP